MSEYINMYDAWLHCFHNPYDVFNNNIPYIDISQSDFTCPEQSKSKNVKKNMILYIYV